MSAADTAAPAPPEPFDAPAWVRNELGSPTGKNLRVAVVDSGWDRGCDDPRVLPGVGLVDPADDLAMLRTDDDHDRVGHGTACIHQILRIAPDVRILPVRVFGNDLETSPGTLQAGIVWALEQGVDIINLSLGTTLEGTLHPLYAACERARRQGIVVVAAGHNSRSWSYPAIFENVIGVSADRFQSPYEYRYLPDEAMEVQAWGVEQPVVWLNGARVVKHGTSFAAPNVAGIVALLLERHPGATLEEVRAFLQKYALPSPPPSADGRAAQLAARNGHAGGAKRGPLFVRPLMDPERHGLEAALRSPDAFTLRRARILLASARGERVEAIARALGCDAGTVRNAIHAFHADGLAALRRRPSRPRPLQGARGAH